ncbi:uncharacterized protein LOC132791172 [Drosophila nasuta]|uniref:uncharacterized protein LOC132791172 n=1 Tax=Drosophila nasuta TaxID=42062 RepID=UPI00295F11BC|nr:uncharacterized protein LOC132791172 [Drosophila nasuta]
MDLDAEQLIFLIESRKPIYNYKSKDHANKEITDKLWRQIAKEMNCEVSDCKSKWTVLRNSYARYLRDERHGLRLNLSGRRKKKWYLADSMAFLKDYVHQQHPVAALDSQDTSSISSESKMRSSRTFAVSTKKIKTEMVKSSSESFQPMAKETTTESSSGLFFKSLLMDYDQLSSKQQRSFRLAMLTKMNELQEEAENETEVDWQD